ncbi:MAG: tetratricopeptide repeat protein [Bacteroidota bacterium]
MLLLSCSKEKDTITARAYHNTTSYFNGYYNAQFLFRETTNRLEEQYRFKDQGFMEVVYYGSEDEVGGISGDLETVIKKNDAVMFKHPNGNWVDDCRLLNGKAWFYQQEYRKAIKNLRVVIDSFPQSERVAEAWFWIAQTQYRQDQKQLTRDLLQEHIIDNDTAFLSDEMTGELGLFLTRLEIEEKNYDKAIKLLEAYLPYVKGRLREARTHYLLGQLYGEIQAYSRSLEQFDIVLKSAPNYDLAFSAKMKIARLYVSAQDDKDDDEEVYKYLTKLLKDEKNLDYRDQIYYEFAMLELQKNNRDQAIEYLNYAIQVNRSNQRQKALSYYKIGEIYFNDLQNYDKAQAYYDSAATAITPDAPEYKEITGLASTLKEYIQYKRTIQYQDSMLYLASLPQAELDTLIAQLAREEQRRKEEEQRKELEALSQRNNNFQSGLNGPAGGNNNNPGGKWYFDNEVAVANGRLAFQQQWGRRNNEDHWRRSNKQVNLAANTSGGEPGSEAPGAEEAKEVDSTLLAEKGDNYKYYTDIPTNEEEKTAALAKIEEAQFKLGQLYAQKLDEPDSATKTLESLLVRFDDSEFTLLARYALYQIYFERKDPRFDPHKDYILKEHPNSIYAYLIQGKDPNDLKKTEEDYKFVYNGLFDAYTKGEYETCVGFSNFLLSQERFTSNPEIDLARLYYIRGMAMGYLGDEDSLRKYLTLVVKDHADSPVAAWAQETLNYLDNGVPEPQPEDQPEVASTSEPRISEDDPRFKGFTQDVKPGEKIYVLVYIPKSEVSKDQLQTGLSNFNKKFYADTRLRVNVFLYQNTHFLPYIGNFGTLKEGTEYVQGLLNYPEVADLIRNRGEAMFISHNNFKVAYGQRRMEDYLLYYHEIMGQ